jgi:4-hydroxybenzoate polyprenyltransferase
MRLLSLTFLFSLVLMAAAAISSPAHAAAVPPAGALPAVMAQQKPEVDQHDDSRVAVQLVVLGIAAGVVVGVGSCAYVLRKKLGLVAPPPQQGVGGHH